MLCSKCQANIADDSSICPQCGTTLLKNQRQIASQDEFSEEPGHIVEEFLTKLWRENRLSSVILSLLLLTHLGALVYFLHSLLSAFEVTVNKISIEEALELCANATVQVYCREFPNECNQRGNNQIKKDVAQLLPKLPFLPKSADAKVTYWNNTSDTIHIERFLHRIASGPWEAETPQLYFAPKLKALRLVIEMANGHVPLEKKWILPLPLLLPKITGSSLCCLERPRPGESDIAVDQNSKSSTNRMVDCTRRLLLGPDDWLSADRILLCRYHRAITAQLQFAKREERSSCLSRVHRPD